MLSLYVSLFSLLFFTTQGQKLSQLTLCSNNPAGPLTVSPDKPSSHPLSTDFAPWSSAPLCLHPPNRFQKTKNKPEPLCIFHSPSTWSGSPLVLITSPSIAFSTSQSVIHDPDIPWLSKLRGQEFNDLPKPRPYVVKKVRGKGQGVIAVQTIKKGEAVMRETPLVLQISNPGEDVLGWQGLDIKGAIKMMLNKTAEVIPKEMKDTVWALAKQGKGDVLEDVMMTNAFDVSVAGVEHDGLYPGIARINHACKPNCFIRYSPSTLLMEVIAYRDIYPDEELTLSYTPLNIPSDIRHEILHHHWRISCTCPLCSSPSELSQSDRNRNRIESLLSLLSSPNPPPKETIPMMISEIEALASREGMDAQIGDLYLIMGKAYKRMKDEKKSEGAWREGTEVFDILRGV